MKGARTGATPELMCVIIAGTGETTRPMPNCALIGARSEGTGANYAATLMNCVLTGATVISMSAITGATGATHVGIKTGI